MSTTALRTNSLDSKLRREWTTEVADRHHQFGALGTHTARDIYELARTLTGTERDELLHALVALAYDGDHVAERILLQLLVPAARSMAHRVHALHELGRNDRVDIAVSAAWESIRGYKLHLRERVMANLTMGTLSIIAPKPTANDKLIAARTVHVADATLEYIAGAADELESSPETELANLLTWAVDTNVVTPDEISLLGRAYLGDETHADIALDLGITAEGVRKRLARIRTRIGTAATSSYAA